MALSDLILEIRTEISDEDSTRFEDAQILRVIQKAVRRTNRIAQRNGLQFAKKNASLTCVSGQDYLTLSTSVTDFDVPVGLWRASQQGRITPLTEDLWETVISAAELSFLVYDYGNDKIKFKGTPSSAEVLSLWYFPTISVSTLTVGSSSPWNGRLDDIIMEYAANRLKNIDEMDVSFDNQLMSDMENQILLAYAPNQVTVSEGKGWL